MKVHIVPTRSARSYQEFLRSRDLSVGVYRLDAGNDDLQEPHAEDELYYVLAGRARFTAGDKTVDVTRGLCLFVSAGEPHRFHDIVEALEVLVVFGPAEGRSSRSGSAAPALFGV
jgi:mannose-6-phosphate isomerase-like protein (cupin superfamily)